MRYLPPFEEKLRSQIRNEMAMTPLITVMRIKERLEEINDRGFDYTYIRKLVGKVRNEISYEIDSAKIEPRLAAARENYRVVRERLTQIAWWKEEYGGRPPGYRDINEALKNIVMMDLAILQSEMATGLYKKAPELLPKNFHYEPLPTEVRAVVIAAWQRVGMLPQRIVEGMVPQTRQPSYFFSFFCNSIDFLSTLIRNPGTNESRRQSTGISTIDVAPLKLVTVADILHVGSPTTLSSSIALKRASTK
jgi:hypothetical protein